LAFSVHPQRGHTGLGKWQFFQHGWKHNVNIGRIQCDKNVLETMDHIIQMKAKNNNNGASFQELP
jgi:hypothetical protein